MTTILLVRHGESFWNRIGVYQGQIDIPLSDLGQIQAEAIADRLKSKHLDVIVSSPLRRAADTARKIARYHDCPFEVEPALAEIHHGVWQGLTAAEVKAQFTKLYETWTEHPAEATMPGTGGESVAEVQRRVVPAVDRLAQRYPTGRALIVGHDLPLKVILVSALGAGLSTLGHLSIENCALNVVKWDSKHTQLLALNRNEHLAGIRSNLKGQAL
ncbi:MAG: histidine phosphatase family protein [Chloroflexi bacterium]|nr:histidine phosphatase family protein [Chloroflexota bacterium]